MAVIFNFHELSFLLTLDCAPTNFALGVEPAASGGYMRLLNEMVSLVKTSRQFPRRTPRWRIWLAIALGCAALASRPVAAQQSPPARITLDQAMDMAVKHNHALLAARNMILQ